MNEQHSHAHRPLSCILMVIFLFTCCVVLLNILIAQLSDTYQNVQRDAQRGLELNRAWIIARVELNSLFIGKVIFLYLPLSLAWLFYSLAHSLHWHGYPLAYPPLLAKLFPHLTPSLPPQTPSIGLRYPFSFGGGCQECSPPPPPFPPFP